MKIAVVEDESSIRNGLAKIIKKLDPEYELVGTAGNGLEGLHLVQNTEPDLVIMDIQMPVMDGRTASRAIRAMNRPDAKTIPIFALSADAFVEDQRLSAESGMNGHFSKPIDFEKMKKEIGKILIKGKRVGA